MAPDSHSKTYGYLIWLFGFTGSHRFYYNRQLTGTLWFFTFGLLGVGWLVDFFLIPGMDREMDLKMVSGRYSHTLAWILLTFLGIFGIHRFYLGRPLTGLIWLFSGGIFGLGYLYDLWNLNQIVSAANAASSNDFKGLR